MWTLVMFGKETNGLPLIMGDWGGRTETESGEKERLQMLSKYSVEWEDGGEPGEDGKMGGSENEDLRCRQLVQRCWGGLWIFWNMREGNEKERMKDGEYNGRSVGSVVEFVKMQTDKVGEHINQYSRVSNDLGAG
jgi:hypothetical protein